VEQWLGVHLIRRRLSEIQFYSNSVIYMSILHCDVEISSSFYVLQISLSSGIKLLVARKTMMRSQHHYAI